MNRLIIALMLTVHSFFSYSNTSKDSLLNELEQTLKNRETYFVQKTKRINRLTRQYLSESNTADNEKRYNTCQALFNEYESFTYDSAYNYIGKACIIATRINDAPRAAYAKIKTGFVLLSSGLFKESLDTL